MTQRNQSQPDLSRVTLAVLAGGAGTRMGRPKGELLLRGRPILHQLLDAWAWPGPTLLVTAPGREHPPGWERFTREAVDPVSGEGPLRGVMTALEACETDVVVITTVDMPLVEAGQLGFVAGQVLGDPARLGMMCSRVVEGREQIEPFPCALRRGASKLVAARLGAGARSVHTLSREVGVATLAVEWPARTWTNLNTPDDLRAL
ncbi:MAG: molybdenum cofactor guanylyltransferase [Tepidisphaeraceae bacterium]